MSCEVLVRTKIKINVVFVLVLKLAQPQAVERLNKVIFFIHVYVA